MKRILLYTGRVSMGAPRCRAMDIAEHPDWPWPLDCPAEHVTKDDIVIMVKCLNNKLVERAGKAYVDIVDGRKKLHPRIAANSNIGVIVQIKENIPEAKSHWFADNEVIALPHAHANNERRERPRGPEVKHIGYTGTTQGFPPDLWEVFKAKIEPEGFVTHWGRNPINMKEYVGQQRQMCCDFYCNMDIVVSYRHKMWTNGYGPYMKGPTKLNNAGSFRIPTVAFPECAYIHNVNGPASCVLVTSINEMVHACIRLRDDQQYYSRIADKAWSDAQEVHIDEIVKTYRRHFGV